MSSPVDFPLPGTNPMAVKLSKKDPSLSPDHSSSSGGTNGVDDTSTRSLLSSKEGAKSPVIPDVHNNSEPQVRRQETSPFTTISLSNDESTLNHSLDTAGNRIVTMTGTIKRGAKLGESVEVQLQLSQEELNKLRQSYIQEDDDPNPDCIWGLKKGIHIFIFTLLCIPVAFFLSLCVTFYIGTVTWYNIYLFVSEEKSIWHKICICPPLILFYPIIIALLCVGIALYASIIQISWFFSSWRKEIKDFEKGFCGWVCHKLQVPECAPYEIVVLDDEQGRIVAESAEQTAQTTV